MANSIKKIRVSRGALALAGALVLMTLGLSGCDLGKNPDRKARVDSVNADFNDKKAGQIDSLDLGNYTETDYKVKTSDKDFKTVKTVSKGVKAIIVPHHLLVSSFMEKFYQAIADANDYDQIIIISPNHFGFGFNYIQTSNKIAGHNFKFDEAGIKSLVKTGAAALEPKYYYKEHGVWTQDDFIQRYFPQAKVVPVIIKREVPKEKLDLLVKEIVKLIETDQQAGKRVLILGSIDFSHYSAEELSLQNDAKMIKWLSNLKDFPEEKMFSQALELGISADKGTDGAVGVDSPESIYVIAEVMRGIGATDFNLWARTSSASLIGGTDPAQNTSHLFGSFR